MSTQAEGLKRIVPNAEYLRPVKIVRKGPTALAKQALHVSQCIEGGLWHEAIAATKRLEALAREQLQREALSC